MRAKRHAVLMLCGTLCLVGCSGESPEEVAAEQQPSEEQRQDQHNKPLQRPKEPKDDTPPQPVPHQSAQQHSSTPQEPNGQQGPKSDSGTTTASGQQSSPPPPLVDPVREVSRIPDEAKGLFGWKHSDADHHLRMARSTYGIYDTRGKHLGWSSVGWWDQVFNENDSSHCYDVALANLIVGRFDTAIAVLEKRLAAAPASDSLRADLASLLDEALLVRRVLTEARDTLRKQNLKVEYPDETIFQAVQFSAPNEFLALNVADAYLAAFPESKTALRRAGELSLLVAERDYQAPGRTTNVPERRRKCAAFWGQTILEQLRAIDPADPYPVIRMMAYELRRPQPRGLDQDIFKGVFTDFNNRTDFTNAQKAFLLFGRSMMLLNQKDGWGVPVANLVIEWLDDATQFDPQTKQYAAVLEQVRANEAAINQMMLARRESDREDSRRWNEQLRLQGKVDPREAFETAFWDVTRNLMVLEHESMKQKDPERAEALKDAPCTFCLGTGRDWAMQGVIDRSCPMCKGTKRLLPR